MATQGPARPPGQPTGPFVGGRQLRPEEIEAAMAAEAKKHGITVEQFKQIQMAQQRQFEAAAAAAGMTPQQFMAMQQQRLREEAAKAGMSPEQFIETKKKEAMAAQQAMQAQAQSQAAAQQPNGQAAPPAQQAPGQPQQTQIDLRKPMEAKPEALAVAKFLRNHDKEMKLRTCIFDGQRKEMFKVKRAFRSLLSPAYERARAKDPLLPPVNNEAEARTAVQLLPLNMLALRVDKKVDEADDPAHAGHNHKKKKRVKGLWDVNIHPQQDFGPLMHYMWIYEPPSIKNKIYAGLAVIAVFAVVLFPLWPIFLRQGVWYLSVGMLGLLGLFFAMAIFRLILFCATVFTVPPGLWLYPNLFEDVGFFDSFRPVWGWQEPPKKGKGKGKSRSKSLAGGTAGGATGFMGDLVGKQGEANMQQGAGQAGGEINVGQAQPGGATGSEVLDGTVVPTRRHVAPTVEEVDD